MRYELPYNIDLAEGTFTGGISFSYYEGYDFSKVDKANGETLNRSIYEGYRNDEYLLNVLNGLSNDLITDYVTLATDQTIVGKKTFTQEINLDYINALRLRQGSYGAIIRNDGYSTYILVTEKDDVDGMWTSQRPLVIDNATGICNINGSATKLETPRSLWGNAFDGTDSVGDTITFRKNTIDYEFVGIRGNMGSSPNYCNDAWRVGSICRPENDTSCNGELELATADDGNEPIVVRQYNDGKIDVDKTFKTVLRQAYLLDENGNTSFPGVVSAERFDGVFYKGMIMMWYGNVAEVPNGWALCNGQNGTPDLTDRFVIGAGKTYNVGYVGGTNSQTLSVANLPSHNHLASSSSSGWHNHGVDIGASGSHTHTRGSMNITGGFNGSMLRDSDNYGLFYWGAFTDQSGSALLTPNCGTDASQTGFGFDASRSWTGETSSSGYHNHSVTIGGNGNHTHGITVNSTGSGSAFDNRPSCVALCYIMKL